MRIQFDPNQKFQLDAVSAVVDIFEGQPEPVPDYAVVKSEAWGDLYARTEGTILGAGNRLDLNLERIRQNLQSIQERNDIDIENPTAPVSGWEIIDPTTGRHRLCPHFSVEMETGTGKTYVYIRTIFELCARYGFKKFIIVVPSVAIREGVLKTLEITTDHFRALYNNTTPESFVYDGKRVDRLHHFAYASTFQLMIINIDAFRKNFAGTEEERKGNVIYKETDKLSNHKPIEFVQATHPIVIIDEPQSVDSTEKSQEAIKALNPLCTLRYSATHLTPYNLVYRLDPIRAFEMRLVKQIVVANAIVGNGAGGPFVRVEKVDFKPSIRAKLSILARGSPGTVTRTVTVRQGADLHFLSGERPEYQDGFDVAEISAEPGSEFVRFSNNRTLRLGEELGGFRDDAWRARIRHTIKRHLETELQLTGRGIKVLSLFFIDRVANYRDYNENGQPLKGKFAVTFEEELSTLAKDPHYESLPWLKGPIERLHDGYFAQDRRGAFKDSREGRDTEADDRAYTLIMQAKEQLLSLDEPLRFIFSHSALREGWDNPNVFQICTLNETRSEIKKRQEIGRGLRIPVNQDGVRVFDESVNKLYVMANESYEDFARELQSEYEEDCGVTFGKVPLKALSKIARVVKGEEVALGVDKAQLVWKALVNQGILDDAGRIKPAFDPKRPGFALVLPPDIQDLSAAIVDVLSSYQMERHVRREKDEVVNRLKKEVLLTSEFAELWNRIKPKTTYRVEFDTETLVSRAVEAMKRMAPIHSPRVRVVTGKIDVEKRGVVARAVGVSEEEVATMNVMVPDLLAFLQNETDLTRSSLARILIESKRLQEFFNDPQLFLDSAATILKNELHRLLVDGIKYERIPGSGPEAEWEQLLFKNEELVNYLTSVKVQNSVYEYVQYDSEVEREFAKKLNEREDIKLFVKLPRWFEIDTPVGKYIPDWAIIKQDGQTVYLVRETKDVKVPRDFLKLRTAEAEKVRCGLKHFEALDVSFAVVRDSDEV